MHPLIRLEAVSKVFQTEEVETHALSSIHLEISAGDGGGATICMVTHDPRYARLARRNVELFDGRVLKETVKAA